MRPSEGPPYAGRCSTCPPARALQRLLCSPLAHCAAALLASACPPPGSSPRASHMANSFPRAVRVLGHHLLEEANHYPCFKYLPEYSNIKITPHPTGRLIAVTHLRQLKLRMDCACDLLSVSTCKSVVPKRWGKLALCGDVSQAPKTAPGPQRQSATPCREDGLAPPRK